MRVGLGRRTRRGRAESRAIHMVHDQNKRTWKVMKTAPAKSRRVSARGWTRVNIRVMKTASVKSRRSSVEAEHASTSRPARGDHAGSEGLVVWASKPSRWWVSRFGPQNRGRGPARPGGPKDVWSHAETDGLDGLGLKTITVAGFPVWTT
jgi:hypothetical protein